MSADQTTSIQTWRTISYNAHPQNGAQAAYQYNEITNYDAPGRPTSGGQWFLNSSAQWVTYSYARSYDLASHVTGQTYPSNRTVSYSYGADGRLSGFSGALGNGAARTYADTISYNAAGQMLQERFATTTQLFHTMQYNKRFQMWDNRLGTTAGNWNRGALFTYYNVAGRNSGNPAAEAAGNNGNVWMQEHYVPTDDAISSYTIFRDLYEYDDLNRIKRDTGSQRSTANVWTTAHQQGFTYDQWGNRTIDAAQTFGTNINNAVFTVSTANNRLTQLTYDTAGNVANDAAPTSYARTYDAENRMLQANGPTGTSYYGYDADGKRVRRITGGAETWHVYGFDGELIAEYPVNGTALTPQKEYGYRNGQMLIVAQGSPFEVRWTMADQLGTPRILVNQTGSLASVTRHDYLPFGEELLVGVGNSSLRSPGIGYASDGVRQKFASLERDTETTLDFAQARYLSNIQGRFTSVDPYNALADGNEPAVRSFAGLPQNWNKYAYSYNNPLKYSDSDGEFAQIAIGVVVGVAAKYVELKLKNEEVTLPKLAAAAAVGALTGGVGQALAALKVSLSISSTIALGSITGVAGGVLERSIDNDPNTYPLTFGDAAADAVGGIFGSATQGVFLEGAESAAAALYRSSDLYEQAVKSANAAVAREARNGFGGTAHRAAKGARADLLYGPVLSRNFNAAIGQGYGKVAEAPFKYPLDYLFALYKLKNPPKQNGGKKNSCVEGPFKSCTYQKEDEPVK